MRKTWLLLASVCCWIPSMTLASASFMAGEHIAIGDQVALKFLPAMPAQSGVNLNLTNGAHLSYGEIIALGDYYGFADAPVSQGKTDEEREQRFINAFNQLDVLPASNAESAQLVIVMHQEQEYVLDAVSKGTSAREAYKQISDEMDREYNCITGGGCNKKTWWMKYGRMLTLAVTNYDHFGDDAWQAYQAGHRVAMKEAIKAKTTGDITHLSHAYAMNAFASHYLTDRFAAGHIRTPRVAMSKDVTPSTIGDLLMKYMHDEDGAGISVHDAQSNHWTAVGDGYYFEPNSLEHRRRVINALQLSANEVYEAYQSGRIMENNDVYNTLPIPDELNDVCKNDTTQLFRVDTKTQHLLRRSDLSDQHDCRWTSVWLGWTTFIELYRLDGVNSLTITDQSLLAHSDIAKDAVKAGLIKDQQIINFINEKK